MRRKRAEELRGLTPQHLGKIDLGGARDLTPCLDAVKAWGLTALGAGIALPGTVIYNCQSFDELTRPRASL